MTWQGTPGPWEMVRDVGHPANKRVTSRARRHIAKVYADSAADTDDVCDANAKGMAAVPQLVEALLEIANTGEGRDLNWGDAQDAKDIAREALKLAGVKL